MRALECVSVINRKCMPRPKILDVNEGVGEALFYPYNVLVNKCSGSCDTINNPMAKLCVPNIIKRINMNVYNFLMRLNETRNVLWHESCKCVCKLNSSVCNNKQIWNYDTCRCRCQCDTWCKPGQYLDHKNCICKNKLIGRIIGGLRVKNYLKINMLTVSHTLIKMVIKSLKTKNQSYYYWNDIIFINDFDIKFF